MNQNNYCNIFHVITDIDLMGEKSVSKQKCNNCKCQCELYKN